MEATPGKIFKPTTPKPAWSPIAPEPTWMQAVVCYLPFQHQKAEVEMPRATWLASLVNLQALGSVGETLPQGITWRVTQKIPNVKWAQHQVLPTWCGQGMCHAFVLLLPFITWQHWQYEQPPSWEARGFQPRKCMRIIWEKFKFLMSRPVNSESPGREPKHPHHFLNIFYLN